MAQQAPIDSRASWRVLRPILRACAVVGLALLLVAPASAREDCDDLMASLMAAQREAQSQMDIIDTLEAGIAAPEFNPATDGWMVDSLGVAITDLLGALNETAVAAERAHQSHCY